jgi:ubiquinone/menaquinone biosynthesis C-methylase UbiE
MDLKTSLNTEKDQITIQEDFYKIPYHWCPQEPLKEFERLEKQRIVFELLSSYAPQDFINYLDVGCGDGRWTTDIHNFFEENIESTGIDFSERAIGFAKLITPEIKFLVHNAEQLPFSPGSFELVTSFEVIEHVMDGLEEHYLAEIRKIIKSNGLFILTTPSWNLRLSHHHFRHYSIERITNLLEGSGFDILKIRGQSLPCYGFKRKVRRIMGRTPKVWRLWRFSYREVAHQKALNLIVASRPAM